MVLQCIQLCNFPLHISNLLFRHTKVVIKLQLQIFYLQLDCSTFNLHISLRSYCLLGLHRCVHSLTLQLVCWSKDLLLLWFQLNWGWHHHLLGLLILVLRRLHLGLSLKLSAFHLNTWLALNLLLIRLLMTDFLCWLEIYFHYLIIFSTVSGVYWWINVGLFDCPRLNNIVFVRYVLFSQMQHYSWSAFFNYLPSHWFQWVSVNLQSW